MTQVNNDPTKITNTAVDTIDNGTTLGFVVDSDKLPPQPAPLDDANSDLPSLPKPTIIALNLENIIQAISYEARKLACKNGINMLNAKVKEQEETNKDELKELKDRIEAISKEKNASKISKIFSIIGIVIGVIASVAAIAFSGGSSLLLLGGIIGAVLATNSVLSMATDGKVCIEALYTVILKLLPISDEQAELAAQIIFLVQSIGLAIATGVGVSSAASSIQASVKSLNTLAKWAPKLMQTSQVISGTSSVATGVSGGVASYYAYDAGMKSVELKEIEAIIEGIKATIDIEQETLESQVEKANALLESVMQLINNCNSTQQKILTTTPTIA